MRLAGERIWDSKVLLDELVWALLTYSDGSQFCFQTTLNGKILSSYGITLEEGCFVRLDKKYLVRGQMVYRQFPYTSAKVSLWTSMTYTDKESALLRNFM